MYETQASDRLSAAYDEAVSLTLIVTSPLLLWFYLIAYNDFDSSLVDAAISLYESGPSFFSSRVPSPSTGTIAAYIIWVLAQAFLYVLVPGPTHQGPRTPGGRQLLYKLNGLRAWILTILVVIAACYSGLLSPTAIADDWNSLFATANLYSFVLIAVFYVKARLSPDDKGDTLLTDYFWYNLFNGGELHPRTGKEFDWKHFNASRTGGILAWTLIDLSFAALQYKSLGFVTDSMILAVSFRLIIVAEFFLFEDLFFETLDGAHERFSFYNIYGFAVMMPHLYTLQTQYLAVHPVQLSTLSTCGISICFAVGWAINHYANDQKNLSRRTRGECNIWGEKAKVLIAKYETYDGKTHQTVLLCSGWWGYVRHANYVGSLIYTWASCMVCGSSHLFPYTEAIMVTGVVVHRCLRDEARCGQKYGKAWDEYCRLVKWRMIPGIF